MKDLKSRAAKIEKDRNGLEKAQLEALGAYGDMSREQHEHLRTESSRCFSFLSAFGITDSVRKAVQVDFIGDRIGRSGVSSTIRSPGQASS